MDESGWVIEMALYTLMVDDVFHHVVVAFLDVINVDLLLGINHSKRDSMKNRTV